MLSGFVIEILLEISHDDKSKLITSLKNNKKINNKEKIQIVELSYLIDVKKIIREILNKSR